MNNISFIYEINQDSNQQTVYINEQSDISKLTGNNLSVFHLNVRSVDKNFDNFLCYIQEFVNSDLIYDVIVLSETYILEDIDSFNIDHYKLFYNNSRLNKN